MARSPTTVPITIGWNIQGAPAISPAINVKIFSLFCVQVQCGPYFHCQTKSDRSLFLRLKFDRICNCRCKRGFNG
ncbi:hypothetical protein SUGI_0021250 [Cryptomeria japonica]|nr:hypothetical protein SUGI_0021250 [Cryptomeria japonica]